MDVKKKGGRGLEEERQNGGITNRPIGKNKAQENTVFFHLLLFSQPEL